jgi:hypothetical protein
VKQPRRDFALTAQAAYLKVADGGTALLGLVRGEAAGLLGGDKGKTVVVVASATDEAGKEVAWAEQATTADVASDGTFVASFKLGLKPGRYSLQAGAVDPQSGKGSLASMPIEVPDFNRVEAAADGTVRPAPSVTSVLIVRDVEELSEGAPADPQHAYAAFGLGTARLVPVFGQVLRRSDAVSFFYQVYDLRTDPTTGKADGVAVLTVLKDGKVAVAKAPPNPIEGAVGGSVIGPVPLEKYEPGKYVVQLKLTDKLAQKDLVQEVPFEVQP